MKKQGKGRTANRRAGLIFALLVMIAMALGLSAAAAKEAFPSDAGLLFDLEGDWRYGQTPPTFYVYDWEKDTKYATDGEIICTYYCNVDGQRVLTDAENSGADSPGGIPRKVGSYEVEATVTETDHYAGGQALGEFSIDQATPTASLFSFSVSPDSAYDGKAKTVIITPKETVGEITVHCFKDGTPVTSPTLPGEYTFSIDVEENENYQGLDNLTDGSWKFTISPRALTLTGITILTKTYDGKTTATISGTPALEGIVGTEDVSLSGTGTATFENANVGTKKKVTVTGYVLSGTDKDYYQLIEPELTADITPIEVTVTGITARGKTYDGTKTATLNFSKAVVEGTIGADAPKVSAATGTFDYADVGQHIPVLISGITLTGEGAENYVAKDAATYASIDPKQLTVTELTAASKTYDDTTDAIVTGTPELSGIVGTDDVWISGTAKGSFQDAECGEWKAVTVTGLWLMGSDADNYILPDPVLTLTANITKSAVTVAAKPQTIVRGDSISTGTEWATLTGAVDGHTFAAVTLTASINEQSTSQGTITPSAATIWDFSGDDVTGNYEITYVQGELTVNRPQKAAPTAPTLASVTATSITLNAADGCEYSMDLDAWQVEPTFSGLESSKAYTFFQRYKEDAEHDASAPSEGAAFQTAAAVIEYSLTFDANGGSGTMEPITIKEGAGVKLPKNAFTRDLYVFIGWNTAADGSGKAYVEEESLTVTANMTLYAQWIQYIVTFDAQNGQAPVSLAATPNQPIGKPEDPTLEGYTFRGWFVLQDGAAVAYDFSAPVSGNLTLYGCWEWPETIKIPKTRTYPLTAPAENVMFTSSSPEHAAVSDTGEVSALQTDGINVTIYGFLHQGIPAYSWPVKAMAYGFELSESKITIAPKGKGNFRVVKYDLPGDSIERVWPADSDKLSASFEGDVVTVESLSSESGDYKVYVRNRAGAGSQNVHVTVGKADVPEIKLSATVVSIREQETATVTVKKYSVKDDAIESVESNNPDIVTSTFEGNTITVKAVGTGKATISVITKKGATGKFTVKVNHTEIKFSPGSVTISGNGTATVRVKNLGNDKIQKVEAEDESVATATFKDDRITVTAEGFGTDRKGKTEITVMTHSGARGTFQVKVNSNGIQFVDDKITIQGLGTKKVSVTLNDGDALKKVKSSNEQVFTATFKGSQIILTGRRFGKASLTAYTKKGGMRCIPVTVENSQISLTPSSLTFQGIEKQTVKMDSTVEEDTVESVVFKYGLEKADRNVVKAKFDGKEITFTPRKPGKTEATVTSRSGGTNTIKMTVEAANLTVSPKKVKTDGSRQTVTVTSGWEGDTIDRLIIDKEEVAKATFKGNKITVTPMAEGKTDIHVISRKGGMATFHVKVNKARNFIMILPKDSLKITNSGQQGVYVVKQWEHEGDALDRVYSSNEHVATAEINKKNNTVTVTGGNAGKATITVITRKGSLTHFKLNINEPEMTFSGSTAIIDGKKSFLSVSTWPVKHDYLESVESYDENVVKVSWSKDTITLTPKHDGSTNILVTTHAGCTADLKISVQDNGFRLAESTLIFENMKKQTVAVRTFSPTDNKIRSVQSANEKIATATFEGDIITVKPHKKGKTTITVSTKKSTAIIKVTVK